MVVKSDAIIHQMFGATTRSPTAMVTYGAAEARYLRRSGCSSATARSTAKRMAEEYLVSRATPPRSPATTLKPTPRVCSDLRKKKVVHGQVLMSGALTLN